jgi:hypothetical protein
MCFTAAAAQQWWPPRRARRRKVRDRTSCQPNSHCSRRSARRRSVPVAAKSTRRRPQFLSTQAERASRERSSRPSYCPAISSCIARMSGGCCTGKAPTIWARRARRHDVRPIPSPSTIDREQQRETDGRPSSARFPHARSGCSSRCVWRTDWPGRDRAAEMRGLYLGEPGGRPPVLRDLHANRRGSSGVSAEVHWTIAQAPSHPSSGGTLRRDEREAGNAERSQPASQA